MKRYEEKFLSQRAEEEQKETPLQRLEVNRYSIFNLLYLQILSSFRVITNV